MDVIFTAYYRGDIQGLDNDKLDAIASRTGSLHVNSDVKRSPKPRYFEIDLKIVRVSANLVTSVF